MQFIETAGGVAKEAQTSQHALVSSAISEFQLQVGQGATRPTKKAPQVPLSFLVLFESTVTDRAAPKFVRLYSWLRLVRVWAALRFDDHRGIIPRRMVLTASGLRGTLVRTKTSGAGKRREELLRSVSCGAHFLHPSWLEVGFKLCEAHVSDRDYLLGIPTRDLEGMREIEAKYADGAAMSRALLGR